MEIYFPKVAGCCRRPFLFYHFMKSTTVLVSLCSLVPLPVFGFGADDASRPTPPTESRPADRAIHDDAATAGAVKADADQVLLPSLRGLAIASTAVSALALQQKSQDGIHLEGFTASEQAEIRRAAAEELGRPVSLRSLERLNSKLEQSFRLLGRPFVQVSFPEQEITSGVIALLICPARAGQVLVAGNPSFGAGFSAAAFRTRPGDEISGDVVLADLDWLNENPLRRASISYSDGTSPDILDLTLRVRAKKSWRVYAGIDNQLSDNLGDERIFMGAQYGDLFGLDHRITAQYTSALETKNLQGFSGIYEIPLPIRHLLEISAGYTESESNSVGPIDQSGQFSRLAVGYRVPLPRWHAISQEWRAGLEFRSNDYLFSNQTSSQVKFFQIGTGWKGRRTDRWGMMRLDASVLYSPGQGMLGSEDADFIALGADGAESWIGRLEFERTWKLGEIATLVGRGQAQWADSTLLSSDQISAGGVSRVRGFDETVGYASKGVVASIELQSRNFQVPKSGEFQAISFLDGAVLNRDQSGDAGQLASVGVGLRWRYAERLSAKLDLGVPVNHPADLGGDPVLHFSVSTNW